MIAVLARAFSWERRGHSARVGRAYDPPKEKKSAPESGFGRSMPPPQAVVAVAPFSPGLASISTPRVKAVSGAAALSSAALKRDSSTSLESVVSSGARRDSMGLIFVPIVRPCDVQAAVDASISRRSSVPARDFRDSTTLLSVEAPETALDVHLCFKGNHEGGQFVGMSPAALDATFGSFVEADVLQIAPTATLDAAAWRGLAKALPRYANLRYLKLCFLSIDAASVLAVLEATARCPSLEHIYISL